MLHFFTAPTDYISAFSDPLTFARGSPSQSITITILDDIAVEDSENFVARLSVNATLYPGVRLAPDTANINIRDNDGKSMVHMHVCRCYLSTYVCIVALPHLLTAPMSQLYALMKSTKWGRYETEHHVTTDIGCCKVLM